MTRRFTFLVIAVLSFTDPFYEIAMQSLDSNNNVDMTAVVKRLEKSAEMVNPNAITKLGELWLLGFKNSNGIIMRNYTKSWTYLQEGCALGNGDACFYCNLIYQESFLTSEFDSIISNIKPEKVRDGVFEYLEYPSSLAKQAYIAAKSLSRKLHSFDIPDYLTAEGWKSPIFSPFFRPKDYEFQQNDTTLASQEALKAVNQIEKNGKVDQKMQRIDISMQSTYGTDSLKHLSLIEKRSEKSQDINGFLTLANNFIYGNDLLGIPQNLAEAIKYYTKASNLGSIKAMTVLGKIYVYGYYDVGKNITKGFEYLEKAAKQGSTQAMNYLSVMYKDGIGVKRSSEISVYYAKMSAGKGDLDGCNVLAMMYLNGEGVEKSRENAFKYFTMSAAGGNQIGNYYAGILISEDELFPDSSEKSLEIFEEILSTTNQHHMIQAYKSFRDQDFQGAYLHFLISASLNNEYALQSLAYMFENSLNPSPCKKPSIYCQSVYLIKSALFKDSGWAYSKLAKIIFNGFENSKPDFFKAFNYYSQASLSGEALYSLGYMYEEGLGCDQDFDKAKQTYDAMIFRARNEQIEHSAIYVGYLAQMRIGIKEYFDDILPISIEF